MLWAAAVVMNQHFHPHQTTCSSHPTPWLEGTRIPDVPRAGSQPAWAQTILGLPQAVCMLMEGGVGAIFHMAWGQFRIVHFFPLSHFCMFPVDPCCHTWSDSLCIKEHLVERCRCFPASSWSEPDRTYTCPSSCLHKCSLNIMEQKTPS